MKLTSKTVTALRLPPGKGDHFEWDDELPGYGLRLRLGSGGRLMRSYNVQYRRGGATRRYLLGSADVLSAEQARLAAKKALAEIALGRDPAAERRDRRDKDRLTLRSVIEQHLAARRAELRAKTIREMTRYLSGPYFRPLHSMAIDTVARRDIASRLVVIAREHGPIVARRARAALNAFFVWAMRMGIVEHNVVIGTIEPKNGKPRERVLSDSELAAVWRACKDDDYGRIARLLILLGARRQEVGGMCWDEFSDLDGPQASWRIPAERSKNGRAHTLPLLPMALDIIRNVPRMATRDQLFGTRSSSGFGSWDRGKNALDERSGVAGWTVHDLRRTFSTRLHDLGIAPHVIEAALNHFSGHRSGTAGVYNKAEYQREIRAALAVWEDYLSSVVEGRARKVVSFAQNSA
jgi:integrase